jgi:hypothetical protein
MEQLRVIFEDYYQLDNPARAGAEDSDWGSPSSKEIPAMLITGDTSKEVLNIDLAGDFKILQKPVDCEKLITCIDHLLIGAGVGR